MLKNKRKIGLWLLLFVGISWFALFLIRQPVLLPFDKVEVHGAEDKNIQGQIEETLAVPLSQGFFRLDVLTVKNTLESIPGIDQVIVKKRWPNKLLVRVTQNTPVALWHEGGVIDSKGEHYLPATLPEKSTPIFYGNLSSSSNMFQQFIAFSELLMPVEREIHELHLTGDGSWYIMLDNGITLYLGKDALKERVSRFVLAYRNHLSAKSDKIAYVDCRYSQGISVGWDLKKGK